MSFPGELQDKNQNLVVVYACVLMVNAASIYCGFIVCTFCFDVYAYITECMCECVSRL